MMNYICNAFVRNDGNPSLAMTATFSSSIFNIVMDYVLMFPLKMGMPGAALATAAPFLRLADLWLLLGLVRGSLPAARRAVDDLKYTRSTRMMLVACGVLLAAHTVLRIASLAAPASVPLGKASSGSFVVFSVLLLGYTVLMVKAYNVQRTKH